MKKILFLLTILCTNIHCQDLTFQLTEDAPIWLPSLRRFTWEYIPKGTILNQVETPYTSTYLRERILISEAPYKEDFFCFDNSLLIPLETNYLFNPSITQLYLKNKLWLMSFYQDILQSEYSGTLNKYMPEYVEFLKMEAAQINVNWVSEVKIRDSFSLTQSAIGIGYLRPKYLLIQDIKPYKNGYKIQCIGDDIFYKESDIFKKEQNGFLNLILLPDGDYLDVYLNDTENLISSLMLVDENYLGQLNIMFRFNADYSTITWPTRADGSMDYPVPSNLLLRNYIPTHKTQQETPLLSEDSFESSEFLLPEQTPLRWIGKGQEGRIKVLTAEGQEGWVLASSLENLVKSSLNYEAIPAPDIPVPVPEESPVPDTEIALEDEKTQNDPTIEPNLTTNTPAPEKRGFYLSYANLRYLLILIGIIGCIIFLIKMMKKRKK